MSYKQLLDGIEWPKFSDGKLVKIGSAIYLPDLGVVDKVSSIRFGASLVVIETEERHFFQAPYGLTIERPPVLDKDGIEIKVGDTVWQEEDGTELRVIYFGHKEDGERMVGVERISGPTDWAECRSGSLTHTQPDSWEKLREDSLLGAIDYWGCGLVNCGYCTAVVDGETPLERYNVGRCDGPMRLGLIARAEKLAGVMGSE